MKLDVISSELLMTATVSYGWPAWQNNDKGQTMERGHHLTLGTNFNTGSLLQASSADMTGVHHKPWLRPPIRIP